MIDRVWTRRSAPVAVVCFGLLAAGCAPRAAHQMQTPFSEEDFRPWAGSGPATLTGQAFLKTVGGDVKTCAGAKVVLMPANDYGRELIQVERSGGGYPNGVDARVKQYLRATTCDAQGNFAIGDLPAGRWFVETDVHWGVPTGSTLYPISKQGGVLVQEVSVVPGVNRAILTAEDEVP